MKICPKCGTNMPDDAMACPRCGTAMPYSQNYYFQDYNSRNGNGYVGQGGFTGGDYKDKTVAAIFAILLGALGIQYFYCGKPTAGILAIVFTIITCGLFEVLFIIQGILMLLMTQAQFEQKYVYTYSTFPLF